MEQAASVNADPAQRSDSNGSCSKWRDWTGFWLLGLCNNFAYVVMLSAAHDILKKQESANATSPTPAPLTVDVQAGNSSSPYDCNPVSTAAVLLADILPTLIIKLAAPCVLHKLPYGDVLGAWGSGTGGAGVAGAFLYSGLTQVGLSPQVTLQIMLVVPFAMLISYFFLLAPPPTLPQWREKQYAAVVSEERQQLMDDSEEEEQGESTPGNRSSGPLTPKEKLHVIRGLMRFVFPLGLVYFAEYFINQGLMELLYFPNVFLSHAEQYRWYQTLYQVGVLVSRSSLCCIKIRKLWALSLLQVVNALLLLLAVRFHLLPNPWTVFAIILYEGLLGGAAYVNTFYFISKESEDRHREFAMAAASVGDSLGIALAGLAAFPVHRYFCSL
ncbi:battenin isoform X2 [Gymnodraco acuticeps]|uniref:Battenin n=1 Tax=Gymnodraco acuticeps TaxID=8218 RepID=A0A6P8UM34_GYMAC|nr:battenin isoform X2 [Gymnodraco acuticeps]